jgi:hypothetical protein
MFNLLRVTLVLSMVISNAIYNWMPNGYAVFLLAFVGLKLIDLLERFYHWVFYRFVPLTFPEEPEQRQ